MAKNNYSISGKLYYKIPLVLESPTIIGSGESENSDVDIMRDPTSGKPLIPATSIVGVCRAFLENHLENKIKQENRRQLIYLFGDPDTEVAQSALQCDDIVLTEAKTTIRDGVAIEATTNTAKDKNKYNYEVIEPRKAGFDLYFEITLRKLDATQEPFNRDIFKKLIATIIDGIQKGLIRLGAKTNKGFGKLGVNGQPQIAELDFEKAADVYIWLKGEPDDKGFSNFNATPFSIESKFFEIQAYFKIKNSLIVRSYSTEPKDPDAVSITSNDEAVLPGTSIMGAVRHRALRILNTLNLDHQRVDAMMRGLFGFVEENNRKNPAQKGRVIIEEIKLKNVVREVQTRIKIDRFTGGTIHGALFEMMPLWQANNNDEAALIHIAVRDYEPWEPGLWLYVLKDLWTGDLAIGGEKSVGRGILAVPPKKTKGFAAKIKWADGEVDLMSDENSAPTCDDAGWKKLEELAKTFNQEIGNAASGSKS